MCRAQKIYRWIHYLWTVLQGHKCCYLNMGYLAFWTPAHKLRHQFTHSCAELFIPPQLMRRGLHRGAGLHQTSAACYMFMFVSLYEDFKSVCIQLSDQPEASPQKMQKPRPVFCEEPQILPHTNFPVITWTESNGRKLVLLWGEGEFDWQGPALDFCWIKRGSLSEVGYIKTTICIFAAILKEINLSWWSTTKGEEDGVV